jgi:hypothetical protein
LGLKPSPPPWARVRKMDRRDGVPLEDKIEENIRIQTRIRKK